MPKRPECAAVVRKAQIVAPTGVRTAKIGKEIWEIGIEDEWMDACVCN